MYTQVYTDIHTYIHTYLYIDIFIYIHTQTYTYLYIHTHTDIYIRTHIHTSRPAYTYIHTYNVFLSTLHPPPCQVQGGLLLPTVLHSSGLTVCPTRRSTPSFLGANSRRSFTSYFLEKNFFLKFFSDLPAPENYGVSWHHCNSNPRRHLTMKWPNYSYAPGLDLGRCNNDQGGDQLVPGQDGTELHTSFLWLLPKVSGNWVRERKNPNFLSFIDRYPYLQRQHSDSSVDKSFLA